MMPVSRTVIDVETMCASTQLCGQIMSKSHAQTLREDSAVPEKHGLQEDIKASAGGPVIRIRGLDDTVTTVPCDGVQSREALKNTLPIRLVRHFSGQWYYSGKHYCFTMGAHVQYESLRELRRLQLADADPEIIEIHSQPFRLVERAERRLRRYTPDYATVARSGEVTIVEVKTAPGLNDPKVASCLQWAMPRIQALGWNTEVHVTEPDEMVSLNMGYLDGFRDPELTNSDVTTAALEAVRAGTLTVDELVEKLQEQFPQWPVTPAVRHLIWRQQLRADLHRFVLRGTTELSEGVPLPDYLTDEARALFHHRISDSVR